MRGIGLLAAAAAVCGVALVISSLAGCGGRSGGESNGRSGADALADLAGTYTSGSDFLYIATASGNGGGPLMSIDDGRGGAGTVTLSPTKLRVGADVLTLLDQRCYTADAAESGDMQYGWRLDGETLTLTKERYGCEADELAAKRLVESEWTKTSETTPWTFLLELVGSYTTQDEREYTLRIAATGPHGGMPSLSLDAESAGISPTAITVEANRIVLHEVACGSQAEEADYGTQAFRWELNGSTLTLSEEFNDCGNDDESLETEVLSGSPWTKKTTTTTSP